MEQTSVPFKYNPVSEDEHLIERKLEPPESDIGQVYPILGI